MLDRTRRLYLSRDRLQPALGHGPPHAKSQKNVQFHKQTLAAAALADTPTAAAAGADGGAAGTDVATVVTATPKHKLDTIDDGNESRVRKRATVEVAADGQPDTIAAAAAPTTGGATGSDEPIAFDTGGSHKGTKCENCQKDFPTTNSAEKKTKTFARELYLFMKLEPTCGEIRAMAKQSSMPGMCVLKGWKPNLKVEDAADLDTTMAMLSERLTGITGVPSTWSEYKKCQRQFGALCQDCWKQECTRKNLAVS